MRQLSEAPLDLGFAEPRHIGPAVQYADWNGSFNPEPTAQAINPAASMTPLARGESTKRTWDRTDSQSLQLLEQDLNRFCLPNDSTASSIA